MEEKEAGDIYQEVFGQKNKSKEKLERKVRRLEEIEQDIRALAEKKRKLQEEIRKEGSTGSASAYENFTEKLKAAGIDFEKPEAFKKAYRAILESAGRQESGQEAGEENEEVHRRESAFAEDEDSERRRQLFGQKEGAQ